MIEVKLYRGEGKNRNYEKAVGNIRAYGKRAKEIELASKSGAKMIQLQRVGERRCDALYNTTY